MTAGRGDGNDLKSRRELNNGVVNRSLKLT